MREIKFRGICEQSEKFKYGYAFNPFGELLKYTGIIPENGFSHSLVIKETVGQFTGMYDKCGLEIFEGDILSDHVGIGVVEYSEKRASFRVNYGDGLCKWFIDYNLKGELESIEVIGNIHQHAHLLEQNKC